jgi:transposase
MLARILLGWDFLMSERPVSKTISLYVGVDVSKDFLDFDLPSNEAIRIENAIEPIDTICALLKKKKKVMVVMEATGGYEHLLRTRLAKHCIFAAVVNPRQVRDFAKGIGIDAKTDPIDSKVISKFGIVVKPLPTPINRDSGKNTGKRYIGGGRSYVRRVLYMSTLAAIRHNDKIRTLYKQFRQNGKEAKVAIVACMRKLITIINLLIKNDELWSNEKSVPTKVETLR